MLPVNRGRTQGTLPHSSGDDRPLLSTGLHTRCTPVHRLSTGGDHGAPEWMHRHQRLISISIKAQVRSYLTWASMEPPVGFEPTTFALQERRSDQLS